MSLPNISIAVVEQGEMLKMEQYEADSWLKILWPTISTFPVTTEYQFQQK